MAHKIVFIFLDGIGLASGKINPPVLLAAMPFLSQLLQGPLILENIINTKSLLLKGIDACLGVEGIPQSATGQTTLFTGTNAARYLGTHLPAFPNTKLRELIYQDNILKRSHENGKKTIFANSYTPGYFEAVSRGERQHSVTTLCVLSAGLPFNSMDDLACGKAVHWDITRKYLNQMQHIPMPIISPEVAGQHLAELSTTYELTLFETFLPDLIGHKMDLFAAINFLEIFDFFLFGLLSTIDEDVSVLLTSDHGNMEDIETGSHTRNPVPLLVIGKAATAFSSVQSIMDISRVLYKILLSDSPEQAKQSS